MSIFILSSTLNYLDRNLLSLLAPLVMASLHFNQTQYGLLISMFSITYAVSSLFTGWLLDRIGINRTISGAVGWWSIAAIGHGLIRSFGGLAFWRATLGVGESAGVAAVGKLNGIYLKPEERALGAAANQIGLSLASVIGPLWIGYAVTHSWREPFIVNGALGLIWIPVWLAVNRLIPAHYRNSEIAASASDTSPGGFHMLRDRNLLILAAANVLWMTAYSLWSNWLTLYLIHVHKLTLPQTAYYVWIPPLISNIGGFFGGWLSLRWMRKNMGMLRARRNAVWVSAFGSLLSLLLPLAPNAVWATTLISLSYFFVLAGSVNIYALPIDIFGPQRAGFALAVLTFAFGIMQTAISPIIGKLGDLNLYSQVGWIATVPLLLSAWVLMGCKMAANTEPGSTR
ncbi:MAG TPA: MFS transporter [Bryobacteraceae bacterium]|nr:MFS transporter [Bryobacteraceae bacterium]